MLQKINLKMKSINEVFAEAEEEGIVISVEDYAKVLHLNSDYKCKAGALVVEEESLKREACTPEMVDVIYKSYVKSMEELQKDYDSNLNALKFDCLEAAKKSKEDRSNNKVLEQKTDENENSNKDNNIVVNVGKASLPREVTIELVKASIINRIGLALQAMEEGFITNLVANLVEGSTEKAHNSAKEFTEVSKEMSTVFAKYTKSLITCLENNDLKLVEEQDDDSAEDVEDNSAEEQSVQTEKKEEE